MWNLKRASEFDVQALVWSALRNAGYVVRGEVSWKRSGERGARVDLLVMVSGKPAVIIEVKRSSRCRHQTKQRARYDAIGLPVVVVCGFKGAERIVSKIDAALAPQ